MSISQRLVAERERLALTQLEMATRGGVGKATQQRYEAGTTAPDTDYLNALNESGVDIAYVVLGNRRDQPASFSVKEDKASYLLGAQNDADADEKMITKALFDVRAAAGKGAVNEQFPSVKRIFKFPDWWIRQALGLDPNHFELILADGISMQPEVDPGDMLLVDTRKDQSRPEGLYVFQLEGEVYIKKLQFLPGRIVRVISANPAYETYKIKLASAEAREFEIIGRVRFHGSML